MSTTSMAFSVPTTQCDRMITLTVGEDKEFVKA